LGLGLEPSGNRGIPATVLQSCRPELALEAALRESRAARGAVVSLVGNRTQVDVARPSAEWLRSVDLYIAKMLLIRVKRHQEPLHVARGHTYWRVRVGRRFAVIILAEA
jgi:hypothetical protein